jgi:putative transposase
MPVQRRPNSLRHPAADYSDPGMYYVTLCTNVRDPLFGEVINGEMRCNQFGAVVWQTWKTLPVRYLNISIDAAIVMPDHFHGIVVIHDQSVEFHSSVVGAVHEPPLRSTPHPQPRRIMTNPLVIGYLKMNSAKRINEIRGTPGEHVWQRANFDRIVRIDREYAATVEYILSNPARWRLDKD